MGTVVFRFEVPNVEKVKLTIGGYVSRISDWRSFWPSIRQDFFDIEREQYASQGSSGKHGEWHELSPEYQAQKEKKWPINEIERASGRTFYSLTGETEDSVYEPTEDLLTLGTAVPYAMYQQTGFKTTLGRGRNKSRKGGMIAIVPARRLIDFADQDYARMVKTMQKVALKEAHESGFSISETSESGPSGAGVLAGM